MWQEWQQPRQPVVGNLTRSLLEKSLQSMKRNIARFVYYSLSQVLPVKAVLGYLAMHFCYRAIWVSTNHSLSTIFCFGWSLELNFGFALLPYGYLFLCTIYWKFIAPKIWKLTTCQKKPKASPLAFEYSVFSSLLELFLVPNCYGGLASTPFLEKTISHSLKLEQTHSDWNCK